MIENPYQASSEPAGELESQAPTVPLKRPFGVTILAALHVVLGAMVLIVQVLMLADAGSAEAPLRGFSLSPGQLLLPELFQAAIAVPSGIGMWRGRKWGWWFGAFWYVYGIALNASVVLTVVRLTIEYDSNYELIWVYLLKFVIRSLFNVLILLYFSKRNVLAYFGLEGLNKLKALAVLMAVSIAIRVLALAPGLIGGRV